MALSVRQPWAWLIVNGFKDIENREWLTKFRGPVLIHAGKTYGRAEKEEAEIVRERFGIEIPETLELGGIVGGVEIVGCVQESDSPWFLAKGYGFLLKNALPLPFRPLAGKLGFFNVRGEKSFTVAESEVQG